jgi:hypothetical protein
MTMLLMVIITNGVEMMTGMKVEQKPAHHPH